MLYWEPYQKKRLIIFVNTNDCMPQYQRPAILNVLLQHPLATQMAQHELANNTAPSTSRSEIKRL